MSRVLTSVTVIALAAALVFLLLLLARAVDDPLIGALVALIAFITLTPLLGHGRRARHSG